MLVRLRASTCAAERAVLEEEIVRDQLPRARALAQRYAHRDADMDDLAAVAALALVGAIRRFDPALGCFGPYATATILGELKRYFRDHCWDVRPTRRIQELRAEVVKVRDERVQSHLPVRPHDLARCTGSAVEEVVEALCAVGHYRAASLEAGAPGGGLSLGERIAAAERGTEQVEQRLVAMTGCSGLSADDVRMVRWRYVDELTQSEIAARLDTSQAQVSRRMSAILSHMRREIGNLDQAS
jgi:RNA polymerase sigma-B factor